MTDDQFLVVAGLLSEIRDLLLVATTPTPENPDAPCDHPEDRRVSLATFSDPDHWVCGACRHEHRGLVRN